MIDALPRTPLRPHSKPSGGIFTLTLALGVFLSGLISSRSLAEAADGLAMLRTLKIDQGTVTHVGRDEAPTLENPKGSALKNLPPRTIVKLLLNPAKGSNINVEIWLPDAAKWNLRFVGLGNGGAAGSINPRSLAALISGGYAVATTDMGTAPNSDSGIGNREVWKDFGFRATHLMTVHAKEVIKAYYGKAPAYAYFNGGSTGGQQALQEAQRYPEDYDGIVASVPAHCRTPLHAYFLWNDQILHEHPFTESQKNNIIRAGNEIMATREIPQTAAKLVSDPRCNAQDIEAVIALEAAKDGLEVGEEPTEPTLVDVGLTDATGFGCDRFLCLLLGADKEDSAAAGDGLANELVCRVDVSERLLKVDDVDARTLGQDEALDLRVPALCLVSEVHAAVEHLANCYNGHGRSPFVVVVAQTDVWPWCPYRFLPEGTNGFV
jgi:hypothetical protein